MKKNYILSLIVACFVWGQPQAQQQSLIRIIPVFDRVVFYDGYAKQVTEPVQQGMYRMSNARYTKKLTAEQIALFGDSTDLRVVIGAACDNYDRIGRVNLVLVTKGTEPHDVIRIDTIRTSDTSYYVAYDTFTYPYSDDVKRMEIGRFITPFMDKNKKPDSVPYILNTDFLRYLVKSEKLSNMYDFWVELEVFGVPYAANTQVRGCSGRIDVFLGSLAFYTTVTPTMPTNDDFFLPLFYNFYVNNYAEGATDILGQTEKSIEFDIDVAINDGRFFLITSNHGANSGGEEYNRRMHYIQFDGANVLQYRPGRTSCEPFRQYNTQANGIYGSRPYTDAQWQSFSNWCPGDIIDTRVIELGSVSEGTHQFKISVPSAVFVDREGYIPLSLAFLGLVDGAFPPLRETTIVFNDTVAISSVEREKVHWVGVYPNPVSDNLYIQNNVELKSVLVFTESGLKVMERQGRVSSLSFESLPRGVYIIRITSELGRVSTFKVVKQ
jgi:hypothetical protein